jgi:hypothetical protein
VFIALQSVFFSCKYRETPVFTGKISFIALGSDVYVNGNFGIQQYAVPLDFVK